MKIFFARYKRHIPMILYLVAVLALWFNRATLIYSHLPAIFWDEKLYDLIFLALALAVLVCIFQEMRCPSRTKARVERAFQQSGLRNGVGLYPSLVSVAEDPAKEGGLKYVVRNRGVSIPDMEKKIDNLQRELGWIYEMLYSPKTEYTYIFVLPGKSPSTPITPSADDNEF